MNLGAVTSDSGRGTGVPHGDTLTGLVDATLGGDDVVLDEARQGVIDQMGTEALVDAAGVIAAFTMQNRAADAMGLPLDAPIEIATRALREELGVERFAAASHTPRGGLGRSLVSRVMEPLVPAMFRLLGRRSSRRSK